MDRQSSSSSSCEPPPVYTGKSWEDIPTQKIASCLLSPEIFASYSGPDSGLVVVETEGEPLTKDEKPKSGELAGAKVWNLKSRKAYGISLSLYDQNPVSGKMSGDPVADAFGLCARRNNAILIVADGVNWGEKSRMAARAATYGAMKFLNQKLFAEKRTLETTQDAIKLLRQSLDIAHETIMLKQGGLTTLCVALVCPLQDTNQYTVCVVNVGDSFAFIMSKRWGLREITVGSHDIQSERDLRDAGGALGPVDGKNPELNNLTCSVTFVDPGDVVFLTTDGISDNFDPVVTKIAQAVPSPTLSSPSEKNDSDIAETGSKDISNSKTVTDPTKPEMYPHERHHYSVKEMERTIHEYELLTEAPCSAQELCGAIVQHVCVLTDPKRKVLEDPTLFIKRKMKAKDKKKRDAEIVAKMASAPGKLDHASIVAYEVGVYRGEDEENTDYGVEVQTSRESNRGDTLENVPPSPRLYESTV